MGRGQQTKRHGSSKQKGRGVGRSGSRCAYRMCINIKVVLLQQLLPTLSPSGSQLNVADGHFTALLNGLQSSKADLLTLKGLHGIGGARMVDEGSPGIQAHPCWQSTGTRLRPRYRNPKPSSAVDDFAGRCTLGRAHPQRVSLHRGFVPGVVVFDQLHAGIKSSVMSSYCLHRL